MVIVHGLMAAGPGIVPILSEIVRSLPPSERGPSAPVPLFMYENWAGVDMMYQLDDRRRRQALVYFGKPQDLVS